MKKFLLKTILLLLTFILGGATFNPTWADTKTEGFETATTSTTYNSTATVTENKSDCSIGWSIYYGNVSTTGKISGSNSCLMRYYSSSSSKLGYAKTTTGIQGLTNVTFKAKVTGTTNKMGVWYSTDGTNWTSLATGVTLTTSSQSKSYDIPNSSTSTTYYIKIGITAGSTDKKDLIIDDIVFTYSAKASAGLAYATASYTNILPGASFATPELSNPNGLEVSFASSNTSVATVNASTGAVTIGTTEGSTTITASSAETETYAAGSATYTITVAKGTTTVTLNNTALTFNIIDGTTQTLTGAPKYNDEAIDGAVVTWSVVSGGDYASVSDAGVVTALAPGSATIRASYSGSTIYAASYADCAVTVNRANTTLTLDKTSVSQDLKDGRTVTLTPTVTATKTGGTESVASPIVTWSSSDATVATVSEGLITGLKAGDVTITASYAGGDNYNAADDATCSITFTDTRTAVNISAFTAAKTTLVIGDEQATAITNDQVGWTSAYTYSSSDEDVATVDENGVITAVAKGTATITATINISLSETNYKAGSTTSKTIAITVTKPFHTVTFYVNSDVSRTASVEEDETITFPTAADTPSDASEFNKTLADGKTFVGWYTAEYSHSTNAPASYVNTSTTTMSTKDVTYYAVYADVEITEGSYTLDYSNESSLSGSTSWGSYGKTYNYTASDGSTWIIKAYKSSGMQINTGKDCSIKVPSCPGNIQSIAITCSAAKPVGFSSSDYTGSGTITYLASGTDKVSQTLDLTSKSVTTGYIVPKSGSTSITKIVVSYRNVNASNFTTDNRASAGIAYANASVDVKLTSGYTGQVLTNTNSVSVSYSSSDETVATVSSSTGAITELLKAGTTTITATFAGNATYKPAEASYDLNVTEKTPCGLAYETDEVAKLTTDAAFTNTLTNGNSLTVSYSSDATGVATVNSSTGEVTIKGAGEATITATFAGDEDYEAGSASYTLTISKANPTLDFASANAIGREGEAFDGNALTNPTGLTVSYSSSDESVATVDEETGAITIVATGTTTITATFAGNETYNAANASYTLKVLDTPTISVSDDEVAYGETFTVDDSDITGGPITVTSGNTAIATVSGLVITPIACGEVEITVSTAEDETYKAGNATFTLTITAPAGNTTASDILIATMDFTDNSGWDMPTDYTTTTSTYTSEDYSITLAGEYKFSSTYTMLKSNSSLTFPTFDKKVTKISVVGNSGASTKTKENIYVGPTAVSTETTGSTGTNNFIINSSYQEVGTTYKLQVSSANAQITRINVYTDAVTVTLNKYGYATYCSVNPMDFSSTEGYTAWRVNSIASDGTITFKKITEAIKGGQGVLLYNKNADGENTSNVTVNFADSSKEFDNGSDENNENDNLLVGTTAPTYLAQFVGDNTNFGLSANTLKKIKNGTTIAANKAYLPVPNGIVDTLSGSSVKSFTLVFEDETTGITETRKATREEVEAIFNLAGQRLNRTQKGINIVNGKKILVK